MARSTSTRVASSSSGSRAVSRESSDSTTPVAIERSATTVGVTLLLLRAARNAASSWPTMVRTPSTSAPPGASSSSAASVSSAIRRTPGRSATAGSTSRGRARSTIASGRSEVRREVTASASTRTPAAPVHETSTSTGPDASPSSLSGIARASYWAARRAARSGVRLATTIEAAPAREAVATVSAAIEPAPTTTTCLPARSPTWSAARDSAAVTRLGRHPVDVGLGVRALADAQGLLEEHVQRRPDGRRPPGPTRSASRVWPRIWLSPSTIESSPAATWNRCETAPSS